MTTAMDQFRRFVSENENNDEPDDNEEGESKVKSKSDSMVTVPANLPSQELEWARHGTDYASRSRADIEKKLPGGVYHFGMSPQGWWLTRVSNNFEFPFKVYDASEKIISRIVKSWQANPTNLGVLMNGLRGGGKTMSAQLLANRLIALENLPVLVVRNPIPLQVVLDNSPVRDQNMMIIFDEFEKTHDEKNQPGAQQNLLTTIDGMSRTKAKRLFLFTCNSDRIDENFRDRPSRIRYQFEFNRVADEVIEGLIQDSLPADLQHHKTAIIAFLDSRKICTIDIVKAVINEVKTFGESPTEFEGVLNITKGEPPAYTISILNPADDTVQKIWRSYFKIYEAYAPAHGPLFNGTKSAVENFGKPIEVIDRFNEVTVRLLEFVKHDGNAVIWLAQLAVPFADTFWYRFKDCGIYGNGNKYFLDTPPEDWKTRFNFVPGKALTEDADAVRRLEDMHNDAENRSNLYGTQGDDQRIVFKIRIEANPEKPASSYTPGSWAALV